MYKSPSNRDSPGGDKLILSGSILTVHVLNTTSNIRFTTIPHLLNFLTLHLKNKP